MKKWFWYFTLYSFAGFLLEVAFARLIRNKKQDRKCFYLLPLCPVYGWGALGILALPAGVKEQTMLLVLLGGGIATAAEYLVSVWDEVVLGVQFWDYSDLPGNLKGRVCLPFSLAWGILAVALVRWVHPFIVEIVAEIPLWLFPAAAVLVIGDGIYSGLLLRRTGTTEALKWYA